MSINTNEARQETSFEKNLNKYIELSSFINWYP